MINIFCAKILIFGITYVLFKKADCSYSLLFPDGIASDAAIPWYFRRNDLCLPALFLLKLDLPDSPETKDMHQSAGPYSAVACFF